MLKLDSQVLQVISRPNDNSSTSGLPQTLIRVRMFHGFITKHVPTMDSHRSGTPDGWIHRSPHQANRHDRAPDCAVHTQKVCTRTIFAGGIFPGSSRAYSLNISLAPTRKGIVIGRVSDC